MLCSASHHDETAISWPPTDPQQARSQADPTPSAPLAGSLSRRLTQHETQWTSATSFSYAHTSSSSIAAFPTVHINVHALMTLGELLASATAAIGRAARFTRKVALLAAVLEVDGPDAVRIKKGPDAGKEVSVLKLVLGDGDGHEDTEDGGVGGKVCRLTAWREVAEQWSGLADGDDSFDDDPSVGAVRRGDIVYLESAHSPLSPLFYICSLRTVDIQAASAAPATDNALIGTPITAPLLLTASPHYSSRLHICYRALPSGPADRRYRPDLRLAASDASLRRVVRVVRWFEALAGVS